MKSSRLKIQLKNIFAFRIISRERSGLKHAYFSGCINNLIIDDHTINFARKDGDTLEQRALVPCPMCLGKICGNHGVCVPHDDDRRFTCKCDDKYTGKFCERKGFTQFMSYENFVSDHTVSMSIFHNFSSRAHCLLQRKGFNDGFNSAK